MTSSNNSIVIIFSIAILLLLALLLLVSYNSKCKNYNNVERFEQSTTNNPYGNIGHLGGGGTDDAYYPQRESIGDISNRSADLNTISNGIANFAPSDALGNEGFDAVSNSASNAASVDPQTCAQRDRLTSDDLLPKDANSKWAQINPAGSGDIRDQNYLTAGYHIGVNTVGQSLRNANLQLRSEIPNPQVPVSPWMISTIEPDIRPVSFEIGSTPTY